MAASALLDIGRTWGTILRAVYRTLRQSAAPDPLVNVGARGGVRGASGHGE